MITIQNLDVKKPQFLKKNALKSSIRGLVANEKKMLGDISIILCSDEYLLSLNQGYLHHDYYTDIITFDYCDGKIVSGDLVVSMDRIIDNSIKEKVEPLEEFSRVVFHGVLHLCGYNDKSLMDKKTMRLKENEYLNLFVSRETKKKKL